MKVPHMDVNTAFLNGDLDEEIYMKQPKGYEDFNNPNFVCRLKRWLYGLKQAPLCLNNKIGLVLKDLGFTRNRNDYGCSSKGSGDDLILLALHVDCLVPLD